MGVSKPFSKEEIQCENIFTETTRRDPQGRFTVTLPPKQSPEALGNSREQAEKRFYSLERKLAKNNVLRDHYVRFMQEYQELEHMTLDQNSEKMTCPEYFMPHHGVFRESSLTTKLRVVFDSSAPSSNGLSLNNIQLVGPVLQDDLLSILLRFRKHSIVISADVAKMYRQVLIEPSQRSLQKIFWRDDPKENLKIYTLNTVTYGQASASYLAIRCLVQLANDCSESHPEISNIIRHDFYVDDLLTGTDSIEHARYICKEISSILKTGCYELRKWYSNKPEVLNGIDTNDSCGVLEFAPEEQAKTLGLTWACQGDMLVYNVDCSPTNTKCTKRSVLSYISKIFDPLGLLAPCTVLAKMFIQRLWSEKISWDDPLSRSLTDEWNRLAQDLPVLNDLQVVRQVSCENPASVELHGFADASEKAYGACIYLRSVDQCGNVSVHLICAKSKVAPIKTLTIPKLELCAALVLARLADKVRSTMQLNINKCVFWSDSTITLAWLQTSPNLLKIFVGNRVSEIQTLTEHCEWRHVPTQENVADLVSRGLYASQLLPCSTWWQGPEWLKGEASSWPCIQHKAECIPELKPISIVTLTTVVSCFAFERFSSLTRLQRVTAYLLRFKNNAIANKHSTRLKGPLTMPEMRGALKCLLKIAQNQSFHDEIIKLAKGQTLNSKNKICNLNPYLDEDGLLRVGGRLKHSDFQFDKKHPIILDSKHHLTKLIFEFEHICLLHPGPQLLLSTIRDKYWPIAGRNLARSVTRKCLRCFRFAPKVIEPIMGDLPRERTNMSGPFHITGIDYAGPFLIRVNKRTVEKCYVGVFVCLSTKALHLELISNLSTQAFIQALRRFASRRGKPFRILSDNGTTFVGANKELGQFLRQNSSNLESLAINEKIEWSFIPPYSPHFGGLWEAGVKSVKHHLKRILANANLTFEEFGTVLCQIEAILNSRPLSPLSSDPNDFLSLTPAHFLIGKPLVAIPDSDVSEIPMNRLKRYQLLQQLFQHFWKRWQQDFISELQSRVKWKTSLSEHLKEGMLVLLKEDAPPMKWKLGRIVSLHPGSDGVPRVATIQTANGLTKRSFPKICPLPLEN